MRMISASWRVSNEASDGDDTLFIPGQVFTVDWSPDGERVASGGKDRNLKMWRR